MKYEYQTNSGQILRDENNKIITKTKKQWLKYCEKNFNQLNWRPSFLVKENGACTVNFSAQPF